MFTGIIERTAPLLSLGGGRLSLSAPGWSPKTGESIAVNGICLTLSSREGDILSFGVSEETMAKTNLSRLSRGSVVNMERAARIGDRNSGHFVYGHIDAVARFLRAFPLKDSHIFEFSNCGPDYIAEKGSVAVNGISLTPFDVSSYRFRVSVVPHTRENTNLKFLRPGDRVNVEYDILAKYAFNVLRRRNGTRAA